MLAERELSALRAGNRQAVQEAVSWISTCHGDAMARWVEDVWFAHISDEERKGIATADAAIKAIHDTNLLDYLVSEGVFSEGDSTCRVLQMVLNAGLGMDKAQKAYLEQLGHSSLQLYQVVRCCLGEGLELQKYPACSGDSVYIEDKWVSRMLAVDDVVGLRLMQTGGIWETSGAVYHFPTDYVSDAVQALGNGTPEEYSRILIHQWLGLVAAHV